MSEFQPMPTHTETVALVARVAQLERERDEARAEVARLVLAGRQGL